MNWVLLLVSPCVFLGSRSRFFIKATTVGIFEEKPHFFPFHPTKSKEIKVVIKSKLKLNSLKRPSYLSTDFYRNQRNFLQLKTASFSQYNKLLQVWVFFKETLLSF